MDYTNTQHGQTQYDPTWNPYQNNGNAQVVSIDDSQESAERVPSSGDDTAVNSPRLSSSNKALPADARISTDQGEEYESSLATVPTSHNLSTAETRHEASDQVPEMQPIRTGQPRPSLIPTSTDRSTTSSGGRKSSQAELFRSLSKRWTSQSREAGEGGHQEEMQEIQRLLTQMFGRERREHSLEEKTRHVGVVWKNLTVKGAGLGAAVQGTLSSPLYGLKTLFRKGPKALKHKPPVRTLIDDFTGCCK